MSIYQISIWDNQPLEEGYKQLSVLNFQKADKHFHEAAQGYIADPDGLERAISASRFWQSQMVGFNPSSEGIVLAEHLGSLLLAFEQYPFTSALKNFRKALLHYIVSLCYHTDDWNENQLFTAFDLLLEQKEYSRAEDLIQRGRTLFPDNFSLPCLESQVLWRNRKIEPAQRLNMWLFLHHPAAVLINRIEDPSFLTLMDKHGIYMTPAYVRLYRSELYVPLSDDVKIQNEEHHIALECYRLIHLSDQALRQHNTQESARYRKRLKKLAPELYQAYFKRHINR